MSKIGQPSAVFVGTLRIKSHQRDCFRCDTHFQTLVQRLHSRSDLCDVMLIVGRSGKRIAAHRVVLMACSDYFSDLLSELPEDSPRREVTLKKANVEAIEKLINYCYTGSLELDGDKIEVLLKTAIQLRLDKAVEGCCDFIQRHLHQENCLAAAFLAEQLNLQTLSLSTRRFICKNFEEVSHYSEFLLLDAKQLGEFIVADDLCVPSEEFVFEVVTKWIEYDPKTRKKHLAELLAQLRMALFSPAFLLEKVEPLCNTVESKDLILNALKSHHMITSNSIQPRNYLLKNGVKQLLFINSKNTANPEENLVIAAYNLSSKVWTMYDTPIKCRNDFDVALMDDNLIIVGGLSNAGQLNTVSSLNLHTMTLTEMGSIGTGRFGHRVAVLNGSIYVIGGYGRSQYLNSVERFDPATQTSNWVAPSKKARMFLGVAVTNGHLYVSGGYNPFESCSSMECYDPRENIWSSTASMGGERDLHCLALYQGYLFAIGGRYEGGFVERYDPHTDTWSTIPCSPAISGYTKCASLGPDLFICNNSKFYMVSTESSCDRMELKQIAPDAMDYLKNFGDFKLVAIPYEFRPPENWIKNIKKKAAE